MTIPVDVHVSAEVSPDGFDQLLHEIQLIDLVPTLKVVPVRRGISDFPWLVLLALPVKPFFDALVQKFANDAYSQLKDLVGNVLNRQGGSQDGVRVLELQDNTTGLRIALEPDLPREAYQQLFLVNVSNITQGRLRYDRSRKEWRTEVDEENNETSPS